MLENILYGLQFTLQWDVLILIIVGTFIGLIFGAIPGLSSSLAIVLLMPLTFGMDPAVGLAMLSAIYIGGVSGGQIPAILLNMPGTSASIATTFDGYPMTQKGQPGKALSYGILASLFGGLLSVVALVTISPLLGSFALKFQTYEYFLLGVFGLTVIAGLSGRSFLLGIISALSGLLIATIGADPLTGSLRFTFGISQLESGINLLPALIGLFVISEVYKQISDAEGQYAFTVKKLDSMWIKLSEFFSHWKNLIQSSLIGIVLGILPGIGGTVSNFIAYDQAKKSSKRPEKFGTGIPDGIIASESTNNAVTGGAYVPMLSLGIPGNSVTAILLAGLVLHGINPGPTLFVEESETVYSIFGALFLSNIIMAILMFTIMIRFFTWALRVPKKVLLPIIVIMAVAGTYSLRFNFADLWVLLAFSFIGYILNNFRFPLTPMILGIILGPLMEESFRSAMMASNGDMTVFFTRPYSLGLIILIVISVIVSIIYMRANKKKEAEMNTN